MGARGVTGTGRGSSLHSTIDMGNACVYLAKLGDHWPEVGLDFRGRGRKIQPGVRTGMHNI